MSASEPGSDAVQWAEARRWFGKADEDLRVAMALMKLAPPAIAAAAFHCQQAAEKILKGLLIAARRKAGKTHQLGELGTQVADAFPTLRPDLDAIGALTPWFVAMRYPDIDVGPEPTAADVADALKRVRALRKKARLLDSTGGRSPR
jgi:HEPN domain-containing protein